MATTDKAKPGTLGALLDSAERSAREQKREERIKPAEEFRAVQTRGGETVGTMALGHYHPKKGEPVPVLIEKLGGTQRIVSLVTVRAASAAYDFGD